jgi:PPK2 family polyphosphate:nucleotide phosphotransferase
MKIEKILRQCRIDEPQHFRLARHDPSERFGLSTDIADVKDTLADGIAKLENLQERLYADGKWSLLLVFQGTDAAGKDSAIKHVMSGVNPQGCEVHSFKQPSAEDLEHDFLWRVAQRLPSRGRIGIFNRSHYEDVLVVRVHPELLRQQKLPPGTIGPDIWKQRFKDIRAFERHLARNGMLVLKFFLHISKEEQRRRFLARIDEPAKRWKLSPSDLKERERWDRYVAAYEDMIRATSTPYAPWYVVPADHKHVAWIIVADAIVEALDGLKLEFPKVRGKALEELKSIEKVLRAEAPREGKQGKDA